MVNNLQELKLNSPTSASDCGINSCSSAMSVLISAESLRILHNSSSLKFGVIGLQSRIDDITLPMLDGPDLLAVNH